MDNEDIILVAKLADASLELAAKYETGDENETEQAATAWQQTCQEIVSNIGRSPQLQQLKNTFQLSNEALTAICLILLPQINSKYCDFYNDFTGGKSNAPTLDLASTIACATYSQKSKLLAELDIESPIFYWNYLVVKTTDSFTSDALSASPFFIDYMLGSSANLLGGRARVIEMLGVNHSESKTIPLEYKLKWGSLPSVLLSEDPWQDLKAYTDTYLKEEIEEEAAVRNLGTFVRFLKVAAIQSGQQLNYSGVASDCGVPETTVRNYFQILSDTLIGRSLEPWLKSKK